MNRKQLTELNKKLAPNGIQFPRQPVFQGEALPAGAEEFDCLVFKNFGERIDYEYFKEQLEAEEYTQNDDPNRPNLVPIHELLVTSKPTKRGSFILEHLEIQVVFATDQNGPNRGLAGTDIVLDANDYTIIPFRNNAFTC